MKHIKSKILLSLLGFLPFTAFSQEFNETELLVLDFLTISEKFITPGAEAAMHQSSAGWYTSAKKKDLWEIDLSLHGNVLFIPKKNDKTTISNSELDVLHIQGGAETATIPTALGGRTDVRFEGEFIGSEFDFQALDGIKRSNVMFPFLQGSVGLPYGTSLTVRYLPLLEIKDVEYHMEGIALQHNINQHFQNQKFGNVQFSALAAYSRVGVFYLFDPLEIPGVSLNQIRINGNMWEFQFIASKEFGNRFEVFSALGLTTASFNYEVGGEGDAFIGALNLAYERLNASEAIFKGDVGFNFHFQKFTVNSVLSVGEFFNYNLGLHYKI